MRKYHVTVQDPVFGTLVYETESLQAVGVLTVLFNEGKVQITDHNTGSIKVEADAAEMQQILDSGEQWKDYRQVSFPPMGAGE